MIKKNVLVSAKAKEILTSFRTIRSFDAEMIEHHIYKEKLVDVHDLNKKTTVISGIREYLTTLIHWGMHSVVLLFLGKQAINKKILPGDIIMITSIMTSWTSSFSQIFGNAEELKKSEYINSKDS